MTRGIKKFLYGILYIIVFTLIIFFIYDITIAPSPTCFDEIKNQNEIGVDCGGICNSCAIKNIENLKVSQKPELFGLESGKAVLLSEIFNPNINYDASSFSYTIQIYNSSGEVIEKIFGTDTIFASHKKYIFEAGIQTPFFKITRAEITFSNISWQPASETPDSRFTISNIKTDIGSSTISISGDIQNQSALISQDAKLIGIFFDLFGQKLLFRRHLFQICLLLRQESLKSLSRKMLIL